MKLAVIFLNKIECLDDLLSAFLEIGISGATVVDSVGMGHIISEHIPIFAGLQDTFAGSSPSNKTILSVVEDEMIEKIEEVVKDVCCSPDGPGPGFMFSVSIDKMFNFKQEGD